MPNKKYLSFSIVLLFTFNVRSQAIINTEYLMKSMDSTLTVGFGINGDFKFGNLELYQFNITNQIGKKFDKHLIRFLFNYEYISENNEVLASDYTAQLRYNYSVGNHYIFSFVQSQKSKALNLDYRHLIGGGYRHNIYKKEGNYFDVSAGVFFENELYLKDTNDEVNVQNYRLSLSSFLKVKLSKKSFINTSIYYQINVENFEDTRLFIEPRWYYEFDKIAVYVTTQIRHHTTPYVDIKKTDSELLVGLEFNL
ncbi:DUF481 domain-containing protein [Flavobacteriaceae bacterium]|uniref:DUF481 domain-containing protein n=1 Tax=Candidatus Arcticimaribacter forsetii TaxID=2820661 RepID=UPI002076FB84|nr:DUF481 domain-containing protein [Candidatus Arcticimaribacter forsetii]MDB2329345.1 DUF481 domain-containing protein [Flavobacteriaceae bacterium]MDB2345784.1 DUF481 domain-containing protein [Flavobacteriaceae bacterium]